MADGNPNQVLFDRAVRHRIALERYSTQDARQVLSWLEDLKTDIQARLVRATPGRRGELERLLDDVRSLHTATYRKINDELTGRWRERAGLEADWQVEKFRAAGIELSIGRLTTDGAFQAAMARPMDGAQLSDWLTGLSSGSRNRLDRALTISWTEGESLDRAVRRIREVTDINKRAARTLVRTANTHISNAVQQASAEANADIVNEVEWRSVLDSRTSPVCRSRDGQRYPVNEGPRPPAHPGCRSIVVEVLDGSPPAQRETYPEWIERQPSKVQDEILGPSRAHLLRQGKFKVTEFTDTGGELIPLSELKQKPPPPATRVRKAQDAILLASQAAKDRAIMTGQAASDAARLTRQAVGDTATLTAQAVRDQVTITAGDISQKLSEMRSALGQASAESAVEIRRNIDELQLMLQGLLDRLRR